MIGPWAATVPVSRVPAVRVRVPVTLSVWPAVTVLAPAVRVRLLNASEVPTSMVTAPPMRAVVPEPALNVPPALWVIAPEMDNVPLVALKTPPAIVNGPLTVMADADPVNVPPLWLKPLAPTVTTTAPWVIVPV